MYYSSTTRKKHRWGAEEIPLGKHTIVYILGRLIGFFYSIRHTAFPSNLRSFVQFIFYARAKPCSANQHRDAGQRKRKDRVQYRGQAPLDQHVLSGLDVRHALHALDAPDLAVSYPQPVDHKPAPVCFFYVCLGIEIQAVKPAAAYRAFYQQNIQQTVSRKLQPNRHLYILP